MLPMHACTGRHDPESTTGAQFHTREPVPELRMEQERRGRAGLVLGPAPALSVLRARCTHSIRSEITGRHTRPHGARSSKDAFATAAAGTRHENGRGQARRVRAAPRCTGTCPACTLRHVGLARFFSRPRPGCGYPCPIPCCCCEIHRRGQLLLANCSPPVSAVTVLRRVCLADMVERIVV